LRKRRKLQLDLRYEDDQGAEEQMVEMSNVAGGTIGQKELFRTEPDWTMQQDMGELVYLGQRKRVEVRFANFWGHYRKNIYCINKGNFYCFSAILFF